MDERRVSERLRAECGPDAGLDEPGTVEVGPGKLEQALKLVKVALLLGTVNNCAPLSTELRGARSKTTSQHVATPTGNPAMCTTPSPGTGTK